jgi:hypothetical protein
MAGWLATASGRYDSSSGGNSTSAASLGLLPVLRQVLQRHRVRRLLLSFRPESCGLPAQLGCPVLVDTVGDACSGARREVGSVGG